MPSNSNKEVKVSRGRRLWSALHDFLRRPLNALLFIVGALLVLGLTFLGAEELNIRANSTQFCTSCHAMGAYVYEEYKQSKHFNNAAGVRPECGQCHVSKRFLHAMWDHFIGLEDLGSHFSNDWKKPEVFEAKRSAMAERARLEILRHDSSTCRSCHVMEAIVPSRKRGQRAHEDAVQQGKTNCLACHYNLVHKEAPLTPAFSTAIELYAKAPSSVAIKSTAERR